MAHIRKHPKVDRWQVRYKDPLGKERSKNFKRKADAEAFSSTVTADVLRGDYLDPTAGRTTFAHYVEVWESTRTDLARSSRDRDHSYLASMILPTFDRRRVAFIKTSEVTRWLAGLSQAPSTKRLALRILFSVLEVARLDGAFKVNPAADVKPPKVGQSQKGRALTDDELSNVLDAAEVVDSRTAAMVWLMARCGLRIGEAMALHRTDIDFASNTVTVSSSMSRREGLQPLKGREVGESRTIPMPPDVASRLKEHLAAQTVSDLSGFVFVAARGGVVRYDNWRTRIWSRIVTEADVGAVTPHDLRHTCATRLFQVDRWNPAEVQAFLGHSDPRTTLATYTHVESDALPEPSGFGVSNGH
jgi:integrase